METEVEKLDRIQINPKICLGEPIVRCTRITVSMTAPQPEGWGFLRVTFSRLAYFERVGIFYLLTGGSLGFKPS